MPRRPVPPLAAAQQRLRQSADELVAAAQEAASETGNGLVGPAVTQATVAQMAPAAASVAGSGGADAAGGSAPDRMAIVCGTSAGWVSAKLGDIPIAAYTMVENITEHRARCPPGWPLTTPHCEAAHTCGARATDSGARQGGTKFHTNFRSACELSSFACLSLQYWLMHGCTNLQQASRMVVSDHGL